MIDGCRCRFMSQRTVCVICVSPSACLALLRGRGRGFDSTNRECICPTASLCRERILSRTISDTIHILNSKRHRSCRNPSSHAIASMEHHAPGGAESFTFLPLLFVRSAHLTSAERGREPPLGPAATNTGHGGGITTDFAASLAHAYEYDMTVSR